MKKKNLWIIALVAIIAMAIIGCKEDEPNPVLCKCPNGTEHLFGQPCCDGTDCKCVVYYGVLPNTTIKIYKGGGVTDQQATDAVSSVIKQFGNLTTQEKTVVSNTLTKIRIISDKDYTWDGHILGVGFDQVEEVIGPYPI